MNYTLPHSSKTPSDHSGLLNLSNREPYISPLRYLINFRGFLNNSTSNEGREKWESLPVFLKHTLFHNEEKMEKIRKLEVAHRFFIYDKFKEQAHKRLNKGRPEEAIGLFEHVRDDKILQGINFRYIGAKLLQMGQV